MTMHPDHGSKPELEGNEKLRLLASELRSAVLDALWSQWRALSASTVRTAAPGAASAGAGTTRSVALVDPEALVLCSLLMAESERRLLDVMRDWAVRNSTLLSVQRMNNLLPQYPAATHERLAHRLSWFATIAADAGKDLRWRTLAVRWADSSSHEPIFADALVARAHGAHMPETRTSKARATPVRVVAPSTLLLRLRLAFGVSAKADILALLLAQSDRWNTVRDITQALGYTLAAVRRACDDLAAARFVDVRAQQPAGYRVSPNDWRALLDLSDATLSWGHWQERFVFTADFLQWADAARDLPVSSYAFAARGRELVERHFAAFTNDSAVKRSDHTAVADWGAMVEEMVRGESQAMRAVDT